MPKVHSYFVIAKYCEWDTKKKVFLLSLYNYSRIWKAVMFTQLVQLEFLLKITQI